MNTKKLKTRRKELAAEKAKREAEQEERRAADRKRWENDDNEHAKTFLDEHLGDLIAYCDDNGITKIRIDEHKAWRVKDGNRAGEIYGYCKSQLGFAPRKDYRPTKTLRRKLTQAGFKTKAIEEEHGNTKWVTTADGYDILDAPGTHTVYYLEIDWTEI